MPRRRLGLVVAWVLVLSFSGCGAPENKLLEEEKSLSTIEDPVIRAQATEAFKAGNPYYIWPAPDLRYELEFFGETMDILVVEGLNIVKNPRSGVGENVSLWYGFRTLDDSQTKSFTISGLAQMTDYDHTDSSTFEVQVSEKSRFKLRLMGFGRLSGRGNITLFLSEVEQGLSEANAEPPKPKSNKIQLQVDLTKLNR